MSTYAYRHACRGVNRAFEALRRATKGLPDLPDGGCPLHGDEYLFVVETGYTQATHLTWLGDGWGAYPDGWDDMSDGGDGPSIVECSECRPPDAVWKLPEEVQWG